MLRADPAFAPVVGEVVRVARTAFRTATHAATVRRGGATRPLYVTAAGVELDRAAAIVAAMAGPHRMPDALRLVEALARARRPVGAAPGETRRRARTRGRWSCLTPIPALPPDRLLWTAATPAPAAPAGGRPRAGLTPRPARSPKPPPAGGRLRILLLQGALRRCSGGNGGVADASG